MIDLWPMKKHWGKGMPKHSKVFESGSITQLAENRPFKPTVGGSTPPGSTNILVTKKCGCKTPMYLHKIDSEVKFIGCQPTVVKITVTNDGNGVIIKGFRSSKQIRCSDCHTKHSIRTFSEVLCL